MTCDVAPAIENYCGPVGVVYYRLMAALAKERDLPPSVTLRAAMLPPPGPGALRRP